MRQHTMAVWRTPSGHVIARVDQGVQQTPEGLKAVYLAIAEGGGPPTHKNRFACARDEIIRWLKVNKIAATMKMQT
jgi:hypothetical protein